MIRRRTSLPVALDELEGGIMEGVSAIVVARAWWESLRPDVQTSYHKRCIALGLELRADDNLSRHFVELLGGPEDEQPLRSEHQV